VASLSDIQQKLLNDFQQQPVLQNGLSELRTKAIHHFEQLGFPTAKNEEWKYTNITPTLRPFQIPALQSFTVDRKYLSERLNLGNDIILLVIENGKMNPAISDYNSIAGSLEIKSYRGDEEIAFVKKYFSRYADIHIDSFAALNTAFFNEAVVIRLVEGTRIDKPIVVVNITTQNQEAVITHSRLLVVAEKKSSAKIACVSISKNEQIESFSNHVTEVVIEENATLEFDIFQNENNTSNTVCNTYAYQLRDSVFTINTVTIGGNLVRNKLHIKLDAENCETHLYGLYLANNSQLIDNHTAVYHSKPHCNSNQLYKGLIGGKAHGVFNGKILVEKDAQKTNAFQSNKNILLSNDAVINSKPQLEIFADDVKCTHGATTGQMDDIALFYLRSRGINEPEAKAMLNKAFASDVLENITILPVKEYITREVENKLLKTNA